jgi:hypothetical protein
MTSNATKVSPTAERMRLYRARRRKKQRYIHIILASTEIDALIRRGWLTEEQRDDPEALRWAVYELFLLELA